MTLASPSVQLRGLAATAVVGSDRAGRDAPSPERLLSHAAVLGTQARAGYRVRTYRGRVPECPADPRPAAGVAPTATLLRLLGDPDAGLIEEWAECARARGLRVVEHVVPLLLDWWARQPQRGPAVFSVCGKRGEWLAALNPAWRKPVAADDVPPDADERWQTGTTVQRLSVLTTVRACDPARALALVRSTWASDGADERRRCVEVLARRASMDDEPFLEAALDDRSKLVRRAAAAVLAALPGSRFKARLNALARSIIVVAGRKDLLNRSPKVVLVPPRDFDPAWERDGVEEQPAGGIGKRAWWMRQILGAADLSVWTDATGLEPRGVLDAIAGDDYADTALDALIKSLATSPDAAWAGAIVEQLLKGKKVDVEAIASVARCLEPAAGRSLLLDAAGNARFRGEDRWMILALAEGPWPRDFSSAALQLLAKPASAKAAGWRLYESAEWVSRAVAPELAETFVEVVTPLMREGSSDSLKRSIDRVRLRADMHKEFAT